MAKVCKGGKHIVPRYVCFLYKTWYFLLEGKKL